MIGRVAGVVHFVCFFGLVGMNQLWTTASVGASVFATFSSGVVITHDHVPLECFGLHEIGEFARADMKHVNKFINAGKRLLSFL